MDQRMMGKLGMSCCKVTDQLAHWEDRIITSTGHLRAQVSTLAASVWNLLFPCRSQKL